MSLTLGTLPSLLTDCVLVGHARKADVVFTPRQWFALCVRMMNDNPAGFFLKPYRDNDGQPKYAKANPFRADAKKQMAARVLRSTADLLSQQRFIQTQKRGARTVGRCRIRTPHFANCERSSLNAGFRRMN
jgi:hypothetical protein